MKRFFTLFIILIISACSVSINEKANRIAVPLNVNNLQKIVYIDDAFNARDKADIVMALRSWECSTKGIVKFDIVWERKLLFNGRNNIFIKSVDDKYPAIVEIDAEREPAKDGVKRITVGLYEESNNNYTPTTILIVRPKIGEKGLKEVVIHEIGHSLNMDHTDDTDTIMYPHLDKGAHKITNHDLNNFCDLYWCESNELKACNL